MSPLINQKSTFKCIKCETVFPTWQGQCSNCLEWNSIEEVTEIVTKKKTQKQSAANDPINLTSLKITHEDVLPTKLKEFDNVLGGGLVKGSTILLGGEPGIGKSTISLQIANQVALNSQKVLYVTGEESLSQLYFRAQRLEVETDNLFVISENNIIAIVNTIKKFKPDLVIIDSIQVVYHPDVDSVAGTVTQVRHCAGVLVDHLKKLNIIGIIIGHVTKEGNIAGPKVLEHLVDVILYFEGERSSYHRLLRSFKNRYFNTHEIGIFSMEKKGLISVKNPSELFLDQKTLDNPGSVVSAILEGNRIFLVEVQALVVNSGYGMAKRTFLGVDTHRANLLIAAMEKILGLPLGSHDIILNIVGGLSVKETALDLAIVCAIISSLKEIALPPKSVVVGEVGLTGEIRSISMMNKRLSEISKLGFKQCIFPKTKIYEQVDSLTCKEYDHIKDVMANLYPK